MKNENSGLLGYALILVLVAVVVIAVLQLLGPVVSDFLQNLDREVSATSQLFWPVPVGLVLVVVVFWILWQIRPDDEEPPKSEVEDELD